MKTKLALGIMIAILSVLLLRTKNEVERLGSRADEQAQHIKECYGRIEDLRILIGKIIDVSKMNREDHEKAVADFERRLQKLEKKNSK